MVEKILICLPEKFDPKVAVIEETRDIKKLFVQDLMASLKSYEQRLLRHSEKAIESAFQSKVNMNPTNEVKKISNQDQGRSNQTQEVPFEEDLQGEEEEMEMKEEDLEKEGEGEGAKIILIEMVMVNVVQGSVTFVKRTIIWQKNVGSKESQDVIIVVALGIATNNQQGKCAEDRGDEENVFNACQSIMEHENDVWILDSGCSNHMAADKNVFLDMDNTFKFHVKLGNGALVEAKGKELLAFKLMKCLWDSCSDAICVYNPFTEKYRKVPKSMQLAQQKMMLGFGFHTRTNEYKVVKMVYCQAVCDEGRLSYSESKVQLVQRGKKEEEDQPSGMDSLHHDIALNIISRLPVTSVIQFRFVCRAWHMLSHDPLLIDLQLSQAAKDNPFLIFQGEYDHPIQNKLYLVEFLAMKRGGC
ncbi:hypothetical protein RJ639_009069 [Escallonia herrerae]|uniref:F-box domain-containing protein n=1 Tax=Escallonia herrerae TaxID=1293975 RepID=A0AA88VQ32_9ASTE|nr:hypothetical protein RJ639_009069 [Escallonia herrerae]